MLSMMPLLHAGSAMPIYMQLYQYIRDEIESGKLRPGSRLPSIRQLAQHLGISKNTVEAAYGQLLAEGYVDSRERGGYTVLPVPAPPLPEKTAPAGKTTGNAAFGAPVQPAHPGDGSRRTAAAKPRYDFRYGDIAHDRFPFEQWKSCLNAALAAAAGDGGADRLGYGDPCGHAGLRAQIADIVYQSRGAACSAEQIFLCAGTPFAASMIMQLLSLRSGGIAMEEPGYAGVKAMLRGLDCRLVPVRVQADGIDVEALDEDSRIKAVYVTPSHQFPLGMVLPVQKRRLLLQWAARRDGFIIEDDYDSEFRYGSRPIPALKALDDDDRVIYLGTLSKSFLPAARLSYVIMPKRLVPLMESRLAAYSQPVSPLIQEAVWLFMKQGHYARHVRRMRRVYQARHKAITEAIGRCMGDRVALIGDKSGMHLLLQVPGRDRLELLSLAEAAGCRVYDPARHWDNPSECPEGCVMLGFGGLPEDMLAEGIRRLAAAWFPPSGAAL